MIYSMKEGIEMAGKLDMKQKKDLLLVGYNYGEKYQGFIPLYVYSILKNYPEYDVVIYSDVALNDKVKKSLKRLEGMGNFLIKEEYDFGLRKGFVVRDDMNSKTAVRWLFYDKIFSNYKAIYIGDIDIFICREELGIFKTHMAHAKSLSLPYSNYIRCTTDTSKLNIKNTIYYLYSKQVKLLWKKIKREPILMDRLSGLHFIIVSEYFPKVIPHFDEFLNKISKNNNDPIYNDEQLLYNLINKSKIGLPPVSASSPEMDNLRYESVNFRPHHGIHLGIFRHDSTIVKNRQVLESYTYREYYKQINGLYKNDKLFTYLIENSSPFVNNVFKRFFDYYENK